MGKVVGIGGLLFRARDPAALGRWYQERLGVTVTPASYEELPWWQEAGPTVFSPFPFGDASQAWMINLRVRDLDAMAAQRRGAGVAIDVHPERYPNGRLAPLRDPEGNPDELMGAGRAGRRLIAGASLRRP